MIKFIPLELTLGLRSKILRNGMPLTECKFPTDDTEGIFHLAAYHDDEIATVATFFPNRYKDSLELGYQLRGMATAHSFQGKGIGNKLVNFAIVYLRGQHINYVWCNARQKAFKFYTSLGFEFISDFFDIPNIGPHKQMYLKIR